MTARIALLSIALLAVEALSCQAAGPARAREPAPPSLVFAGDVLLAGRAGRLIEEEGAAAPLAGVREALRGAGVAIGNLECALATGGTPVEKEHTFRADPAAAAALADAGFDLVTLANNHALDYGPEALLETLDALYSWGIIPVGAGANAEEARRWAVVERGSPPVKIAVLAFSNMLPESFYAGPERPGTNPVRLAALTEDVAAAREQADVVVVLFHWGSELASTPSKVQRRLAAAAAEAGADLVVGHHPHVVQGLEVRGHTLIAYSLGNLLFPSRKATRRTMLLRYTPEPPQAPGSAAPRSGPRAEIIPCVIEGFQPRLATDAERAEILTHVARLSRRLGAALSSEDGTITVPPRPISPEQAAGSPSGSPSAEASREGEGRLVDKAARAP